MKMPYGMSNGYSNGSIYRLSAIEEKMMWCHPFISIKRVRLNA